MRLHSLSFALVLALAALAGAAGCGVHDERAPWQVAMHAQGAEPSHPRAGAAEQVFPVQKPPFTPGIFPCSRCHEGGTPVADTRPAIPHKLHVGRGLECTDCHVDEEKGPDPRIPDRSVCEPCHGDPAKLSAGAKAYFDRVTQADGTTLFPNRWKTRDVDPKHSKHIKAGLSCVDCHGEPSEAPFAKPKAVTLMDRCIRCHEEKAKPVKCETCHAATTEKAHAKIVLHHAQEQRGCLDCHDAANRDVLRLANGTHVTFEESFKLCGQCHGTQYRDWKIGLHGKRTGSWNGRREYRLCVQCHYPHEPRFKPMAPMPRPARPEEVR
ncbi:MAG: cytochrome c3 family protein [Planctomycetes bacterium]|nr:cytochrome c3 family protein [Planctomycetota bacterium]